MSLRYEPCPEQVKSLCEEVKNEDFSHLDGTNILYVFDTKKKMSQGSIVIARIKIMNDD
jgi:hypothetical protein